MEIELKVQVLALHVWGLRLSIQCSLTWGNNKHLLPSFQGAGKLRLREFYLISHCSLSGFKWRLRKELHFFHEACLPIMSKQITSKAVNIQSLQISIFRQPLTWDLVTTYSKNQWAENARLSLDFNWSSPGICPSFRTPVWTSLSIGPAFIFHLYPCNSQTCDSKWSDSNSRFFLEARLGHCFVNSSYIYSLWATPHISWYSLWASLIPIHSVNSIDRHTGRQIDYRMKGAEQISDASILREI